MAEPDGRAFRSVPIGCTCPLNARTCPAHGVAASRVALRCSLCEQSFGPEEVGATPPGTTDVVHVCCWYGRCEHLRTNTATSLSAGEVP